jgi:hypothetical protein
MSKENLKIVCVLYDDPVDGYPPKYARDETVVEAGGRGEVRCSKTKSLHKPKLPEVRTSSFC